MTDTITGAPAAAGPPGGPPMTIGDRIRRVVFSFGEVLITLGLVVLLFVVYEVWITNLFADANNSAQINKLKVEWLHQDTVNAPTLPSTTVATVPVGSGIGILYIPRLGNDYHEAIVQGNTTPDDDQLEQGTAHYGGTQMPGQVGNFAVAGHRVGKGEPFLNLDQLRSGDPVIVQTRTYWYVYRVLGQPAGQDPQSVQQAVTTSNGSVTLPGREIIDPTDGNVLFPVPDHPNLDAGTALMTMTTCHPKFTASHRMIVYSMLAQKVPASGLTMPAAVSALFSDGGAS